MGRSGHPFELLSLRLRERASNWKTSTPYESAGSDQLHGAYIHSTSTWLSNLVKVSTARTRVYSVLRTPYFVPYLSRPELTSARRSFIGRAPPISLIPSCLPCLLASPPNASLVRTPARAGIAATTIDTDSRARCALPAVSCKSFCRAWHGVGVSLRGMAGE